MTKKQQRKRLKREERLRKEKHGKKFSCQINPILSRVAVEPIPSDDGIMGIKMDIVRPLIPGGVEFERIANRAEVIAKDNDDRNSTLSAIDGLLQEETEASLDSNKQKVACFKGCSACCRIRVDVADAEAQRLVDFIKEMPSENKQRVLQRIAEVKPNLGEHDANQCPLLENEVCTAYSVRPTACRQFCATDVPWCLRALADSSIPVDERGLPHFSLVKNAIWEGLRRNGWDSGQSELISLLKEKIAV